MANATVTLGATGASVQTVTDQKGGTWPIRGTNCVEVRHRIHRASVACHVRARFTCGSSGILESRGAGPSQQHETDSRSESAGDRYEFETHHRGGSRHAHAGCSLQGTMTRGSVVTYAECQDRGSVSAVWKRSPSRRWLRVDTIVFDSSDTPTTTWRRWRSHWLDPLILTPQ